VYHTPENNLQGTIRFVKLILVHLFIAFALGKLSKNKKVLQLQKSITVLNTLFEKLFWKNYFFLVR